MKLQGSSVYLCLLAASVLCLLDSTEGKPYTKFHQKSNFHQYLKNLASGRVRLGLGFTLPQVTHRRIELDLLQAVLQGDVGHVEFILWF